MFYISEIIRTAPATYKNDLQRMVYETLATLAIPFERVDTDDAITMEDCMLIDEKLTMKTVKTLFLCNRQQTSFYLFITSANKPFNTKDFNSALTIPRVSFASESLLLAKPGVKIGAATIFGVLRDPNNEISVIIDKDVLSEEWYGCSDGTTTGYMKIKMESVMKDLLDFAKHTATFINM